MTVLRGGQLRQQVAAARPHGSEGTHGSRREGSSSCRSCACNGLTESRPPAVCGLQACTVFSVAGGSIVGVVVTSHWSSLQLGLTTAREVPLSCLVGTHPGAARTVGSEWWTAQAVVAAGQLAVVCNKSCSTPASSGRLSGACMLWICARCKLLDTPALSC
jgi:hypothetical protein